jgi:hypothetical protein
MLPKKSENTKHCDVWSIDQPRGPKALRDIDSRHLDTLLLISRRCKSELFNELLS